VGHVGPVHSEKKDIYRVTNLCTSETALYIQHVGAIESLRLRSNVPVEPFIHELGEEAQIEDKRSSWVPPICTGISGRLTSFLAVLKAPLHNSYPRPECAARSDAREMPVIAHVEGGDKSRPMNEFTAQSSLSVLWRCLRPQIG
jgi:hypothetical protein